MRKVISSMRRAAGVIRRNRWVVFAMLSAFALTGVSGVASAQSFNITMDGLMQSASDIFNGLWPAFAIIAGLSLGFVILKFVLSAIRGAFGGG